MSLKNKNLSRRKLLSLAGGAAALLATTKTASAALKGRSASIAGRKTLNHSTGQGPVVRDGNQVADASIPPPAETREFGPQPAFTEPSTKVAGPVMREQAMVPASLATAAAIGLHSGAELGDYSVVAVHEMHLGAIPVVIENASGRRFQVDVMRRVAGSPAAPASTNALSFYLANEGNGSKKSREVLGLGAMALASAVAVRGGTIPAELLSMTERNARFPGGNFAVAA